MNPDTIGRYVSNRWGTTKAKVTNESHETQTVLIVVTPPGAGSLQYAKKFTVPGRSIVEAMWPVRLGQTNSATGDFEYLLFPNGAEDGLIRRREDDGSVPAYSAIVEPNSSFGMTGILYDADEPAAHLDPTFQMLRVMSYSQRKDQSVASIRPVDLSVHGECLEPYDHLTLTSSALLDYPDAIECIQAWLQRGGRLWIRLDRTGMDTAHSILGDALPLSLVDECTTNDIVLTLNSEYSHEMFPTREVERTFDEPIRYVRVVPHGGEAIWNIDGWPVAIRAPVGRGTVVITTVEASAFILPHKPMRQGAPEFQLIPSAEFIEDTLFQGRPKPVLRQNVVAEQAAGIIGFQIPSRRTAIGLTLCFPGLLLGIGLWLQRREQGERLVLVLPMLAVFVALPAIALGALGRRVASKTAVETAFVQSVPGTKRLASDGFVSVFNFGANELHLSATNGTIAEENVDQTNRNYRRLVWTGIDACHWEGLDSPDGIETFSVRSLETLERPLSATATFDEFGVVGKLESGGLTKIADLIMAGLSPDRMRLRLESGTEFRGRPQDVLAVGDFSGSTLVSDQQRRRAEVYAAVFGSTERNDEFPDAPCLLFWAQANRQMLDRGDSNTRQERSLLVAQPLRMERPLLESRITIPSPLLPLRTMPDADGTGLSAVFNNGRRQWFSAEPGSRSFMEFQIPSVCLPFEVDTAELALFIRAGSRTVSVFAGSFETQTEVCRLESPLGAHSILIPVDLVRESCRGGALYVSLTVSDLEKSLRPVNASETQNDYWEISRMGLTLKGKRTAEVP
ncbi:MAG: hypothetical protein KDB01_02515 [Planctomycetaceae bacterium]|nr:hypothetical protein [Planctomycetaceae bacterium]